MRSNRSLLNNRADIVPHFDKLLHRTGIVLTGTWKVTEDSDYTGIFAPGTEGLVVVRCSSLLGRSRRTWGVRRGFGLAAKIFPTTDPDEQVETANLILIDNLTGTRARRFTDEKLTNEPALSINLTIVRFVFALVNALITFRMTDTNANYRPLTALAEVGLAEGQTAKAPHWAQGHHEPANGQSDEADLRDELNVENYQDGVLRFVVSTAPEDPDGQRVFTKIGELALDECCVSESGDHRIRFWHQANRERELV